MLKIKDNVGLKKLEKYGLKPCYKIKNENTGETFLDYLYSTKYEARYGYIRLRPKKVNKVFFLNWFSKVIPNSTSSIPLIFQDETYLDMDLLYDLIKDGLVEKVEE